MSKALPLLAVCGSTGQQGRAVSFHHLSTGRYRVRALVRNKESTIAKELAERGAELIIADQRNVPSLKAALKGADFVYSYTIPQDDGTSEVQLGKNVVDACLSQDTPPFFIYNTARAASKISNGKYKVAMLDNKAEIEEYARSKLPSAFVLLTTFFENLIQYHWFVKNKDGSLQARAPIVTGDLYQGWISIHHDLGPFIERIIENKATSVNRTFKLATDYITWKQVTDRMSKVLKKPVDYVFVDEDQVKNYMGSELADLLSFYRDYDSLPDTTQVEKQKLDDIFKGLQFETLEEYTKRVIQPTLDD